MYSNVVVISYTILIFCTFVNAQVDQNVNLDDLMKNPVLLQMLQNFLAQQNQQPIQQTNISTSISSQSNQSQSSDIQQQATVISQTSSIPVVDIQSQKNVLKNLPSNFNVENEQNTRTNRTNIQVERVNSSLQTTEKKSGPSPLSNLLDILSLNNNSQENDQNFVLQNTETKDQNINNLINKIKLDNQEIQNRIPEENEQNSVEGTILEEAPSNDPEINPLFNFIKNNLPNQAKKNDVLQSNPQKTAPISYDVVPQNGTSATTQPSNNGGANNINNLANQQNQSDEQNFQKQADIPQSNPQISPPTSTEEFPENTAPISVGNVNAEIQNNVAEQGKSLISDIVQNNTPNQVVQNNADQISESLSIPVVTSTTTSNNSDNISIIQNLSNQPNQNTVPNLVPRKGEVSEITSITSVNTNNDRLNLLANFVDQSPNSNTLNTLSTLLPLPNDGQNQVPQNNRSELQDRFSQDTPVTISQQQTSEDTDQKQAANARYQFANIIDDDLTGLFMMREETRNGLKVVGKYAYDDGHVFRNVEYEADEKGFRIIKDQRSSSRKTSPNPNGKALVKSYMNGSVVDFQITKDDIQPKK